jgi:uncharacterized membrane protein YedE/YeeE
MANFTPISAAIGGGLIGLSVALLMQLNGRIAGISGIFGNCLGEWILEQILPCESTSASFLLSVKWLQYGQ